MFSDLTASMSSTPSKSSSVTVSEPRSLRLVPAAAVSPGQVRWHLEEPTASAWPHEQLHSSTLHKETVQHCFKQCQNITRRQWQCWMLRNRVRRRDTSALLQGMPKHDAKTVTTLNAQESSSTVSRNVKAWCKDCGNAGRLEKGLNREAAQHSYNKWQSMRQKRTMPSAKKWKLILT